MVGTNTWKYLVSGLLQLFAISCFGSIAFVFDDWYSVDFDFSTGNSIVDFGLYPGPDKDVVCDGASRLAQFQARCHATVALCCLGAVLAIVAVGVSCCCYSTETRRSCCVSVLGVLSTLSVAIALTIYGVTMRHWYFCGKSLCEWAGEWPGLQECNEGFGVSFYFMCVVLGLFILATGTITVAGCVQGSCTAEADHERQGRPNPPRAAVTPAPPANPCARKQRAPRTVVDGTRRAPPPPLERAARPPYAVVTGEVAGPGPSTGAADRTWIARRDPDGRTFYECSDTGATRWDRPGESDRFTAVAVGLPPVKQ